MVHVYHGDNQMDSTRVHMQTLQDLIIERLAVLGLSQKELAANAGLKPTYVNDILFRRKRSIQPRFVSRLAAALQVQPETILAAMPTAKREPVASKKLRHKAAPISSQSPYTKPLYSAKWAAIQTDPYINAGSAIPLFRKPFKSNLFALLKHERLPEYVPLEWPAALGRQPGTYALTSGILGTSILFTNSIVVAAPECAIMVDDYFVCYLRYGNDLTTLRVALRKLIGNDAGGFHVRTPDGRIKDYIPISVLKRAHRVIGVFEDHG